MHKLARHIFIIWLLSGVGIKVFGQMQQQPVLRRPPTFQQRVLRRQGGGPNKIEAIREQYIGQRLSLTPEESQRFWPIYRRYEDALKEVRRKKRLNNSNSQVNGSEQIQRELFYESELVNVRKYYTDEFLKILPPEKVSQLIKSEREFTDELIKQLGERSVPIRNNP